MSDAASDKRHELPAARDGAESMATQGKTGKLGIGQLLQKLVRLVVPESMETKMAKWNDFLKEAEQQAAAADATRRAERLARGLSARAGTGNPGPRSFLFQAPEEPVKIDLKGRKSEDITLDEYRAAKALIDKRVVDQMPLGASRVGGLPDLPPGVDWPRHKGKLLPFVAQIDLSAFPNTGGLLPPDGWLYAFALVSNEEEHYPPPQSVFVYRGKRDALVRSKKPKLSEFWSDWGEESLYELVPVLAALPAKKRAKRKSDDDDDDDREHTAGWLLGEMDDVFGTPGEVADRELLDGDDWINLLAVESVGSMQWSDCGHLYHLIRRSDLARGDFSHVLASVQSS